MSTAFVSELCVGIYVQVPDLRLGMREGYTISPVKLRQIAERFGRLAVRSAFVDQGFMSEPRLFSEWVGAGFRLLAIPGNKVNYQKKVRAPRIVSRMMPDVDENASVSSTTLVNAPSIQAPISEEVLRDVEERRLDIVILVGTNGFPPGLFGALRNSNVRIVAIAASRNARVSRSADLTFFASDLSDGKTIPADLGKELLSENSDSIDRISNVLQMMAYDGARHPNPPINESWPAADYLENTDAPTYKWVERILTVSSSDTNTTLQLLLAHLKERELPKVALAVLVVLNHLRPGAESRTIPLDRIYTQLLRLNIDIDIIGRFALRLLTEERTIEFPEHGYGLYRRGIDDPVHVLARCFFKATMRRRGRLVPYERSSIWAEQALAALEIFTTDPGALDARALQDLKDAVLFFTRFPTAGQRMDAYADVGLSPREGLKFEQQFRELLSLPTGDRESLRGDAAPDSADSALVLRAANGD